MVNMFAGLSLTALALTGMAAGAAVAHSGGLDSPGTYNVKICENDSGIPPVDVPVVVGPDDFNAC